MKTTRIFGLNLVFQFLLIIVNGQELKPELVLQTGHVGGINSVAFSPDGKTLASGGAFSDHSIKLWDLATARQLRSFELQKGMVISVTLSPNGKILASGSSDKTIKLWNVETGQLLKSLEIEVAFAACIAFSPDGKILAGGGTTIKLWDVETGQEIKWLKGFMSSVGSITFSPDGKTLATGSSDGMIRLWNVETGHQVKSFKTHSDFISSVVFSSDGKILVSGSSDRTIKLWKVTNGQLLRSIKVSSVNSIAASSDGIMFASGGSDGKIKLWNIKNGRLLKSLAGHRESVYSVAFSPDGTVLASASHDQTIKLWDIKKGKELKSIEEQTSAVNSIALSPNGKILASGSDSAIKLWNLESGDQLRVLQSGKGRVTSVAFSPDGKILASSEGINIKLWNVNTGQQIKILRGHTYGVMSVVFSPDGKLLASSSVDQTIKLWNFETGQAIKSLAGHRDAVISVVFSPDGKKLASGSHLFDPTIKLWDTESGRLLKSWEDSDGVHLVTFSPDGKIIASGSSDDTIKLWNAETGQLLKSLQGHTESVRRIDFSPDGQKLVSGATDNRVILWDLESGQQLKSLKGHTSWVNSVAFSPDGKFLISGSSDATIKIWPTDHDQSLATLVSLDKDNWLVITPDGLFDGSPNAWKQLLWRFDNNTFSYAPVEAFFKEFYYPGLLQEIIQGKSPRPPEKDLSQIDIRQPTLKISEIDGQAPGSKAEISADKSTVKVKLEIIDNINKGRQDSFPQSSGANDVRLFRNGSLVKLWDQNAFALTEKDGCGQIPAAKDSPRKAVCQTEIQITAGKNDLTVYAFNHDNVKSNDATAEIKGADSLKRKGKLRILSIGVNQYQNKNHNLKFAVPDAVEFGLELRRQQLKLGNFDIPEVIELTDSQATKQNILYALEKFAKGVQASKSTKLAPEIEKKFATIEKTQPEDVLVIYFAGHGTASKDRFYLIPTDGFPTTSANEQARITALQQQSVSDLELEQVLRDLDVGQLLLIIDACNSGQALEAEEKRRGPMNSRGLAQLAFEKGMSILTAAQSYQAALEVSRTSEGKKIEHGLLTYSLLEGLINLKADVDANKSITEREWFSYAVEEVPQMQIEAMKQRRAEIEKNGRGSDLVYLDGDDPKSDPEKRGIQTPRVFYRREAELNPLIVAKP